MIDNFRSQLIKFNEKKIKEAKGTATLSDAEFSRVLIHLDDQTVDEYNSFEKDCVDNSDSTAVLVKQFQETNRKLIVTTIQKMAKAVNSKRYENLMDEYHDKKVVFIIDECHRSQFGRISKNPLKSASGFAIIFAYLYDQVQGLRIRAGRPIHEERTSSQIFDGKGLDSHAE